PAIAVAVATIAEGQAKVALVAALEWKVRWLKADVHRHALRACLADADNRKYQAGKNHRSQGKRLRNADGSTVHGDETRHGDPPFQRDASDLHPSKPDLLFETRTSPFVTCMREQDPGVSQVVSGCRGGLKRAGKR